MKKGFSKLTYEDLHILSTSLAIQLRYGITRGEVFCVFADRSINWIIAIFGIPKAGRTYCPLDKSLSIHIQNQNFCQSGGRILLAKEIDSKILKPSTCELFVSVNKLFAQEMARDDNLPLYNPAPDAGAYFAFPLDLQEDEKEFTLYTPQSCRISKWLYRSSHVPPRVDSCPSYVSRLQWKYTRDLLCLKLLLRPCSSRF